MTISKNIWNGIQWHEEWLKTDISTLNKVLPEWTKLRQYYCRSKDSLENFTEKLKRAHAVETGIVEQLDAIDRGTNDPFSYVEQQENIFFHSNKSTSKTKLIDFMNDYSNSLDYVFDFINMEKTLSKEFIKELHYLVCLHQEYTEVLDDERTIKIPLRKGEFRTKPYSYVRIDGVGIVHCPPNKINMEIDKLLKIYIELKSKNIPPLIIAAWFHHSFAQIHPFDDGNGRMARLLSTFILLKNNLLPLTINRDMRMSYINALELADRGNYKDLVGFFCQQQVNYIELFLAEKIVSKSLSEVSDFLQNQIIEKEKRDRVKANLYDFIDTIIQKKVEILNSKFEKHNISFIYVSEREKNIRCLIVQLNDKTEDNLLVERVYTLDINIAPASAQSKKTLLITFDFTMVTYENSYQKNMLNLIIPVIPYVISLEEEFDNEIKKDIDSYLEEVLTLTLARVTEDVAVC